ncbi:MAG: AsmA-like C-terminal region-containing protein [Flavobacteriales bacterium]
MRILKKILLWLLGIIVLLVVAVFIVLRYYEDDVVNYAISQSKEKFKTRVEFGPADLAFWETFPNASIRFTDVYVEETFETKDTLLFAKKALLEFNLFDLFRGNYNIKAVDVQGALCRMKVDEEGKDNYHFWKTEESDSSEVKMDIEALQLSDATVVYSNAKTQFYTWLYADNAEAKGFFTSSQFDLDAEADVLLHDLTSGDTRYANTQTVALMATLNVNNESDQLLIKESEVEWGKALFNTTGSVDYKNETAYELNITATEVDLQDIKSSLPQSTQQTLAKYSADGEFNFEATLKKAAKKELETNVHCTISNGELEHDDSGVTLDNMQCELKYLSQYPAEILTIRSMKANMNTGYLEASGTIKNMSEPDIDLQLNAQADLNDLKNFFAWDTLDICEGNLSLNANMKGKLKYIKTDSTYNWNAIQTAGNAQVNSARLRTQNSNREFQNVQMAVNFNNKDAQVQNLSGTVNGSDFTINGTVSNLLPFLTSPTERISMNANLNSTLLDFTNLLETEESTSSNEAYHFELPERVDFRLNSTVKKFVFRKFEATDIKGVAELRNKRFVVDPVAFNTADGQFSAQLVFEEASETLFRMNCLATLKSINIQKLFTEFENFDQTFIQDQNLKGDANATVQFRTMLTTDLEVQMDKIESLIDISIENGELNNLESLQDIATYIRGNKWAAPFVDEDQFAEKMRNIKFSKLENVIEIKDRMITIPQMDISSTALDISAKGTHTFDNAISYTIGFSLRELLVRRETEWNVQDDGLGKRLFVTMKGTTENPEFTIDKDAAKENRQQEMQAEKQSVKALLKEEFGLFKRDNSIGTYKEQTTPSGGTTTIDWGDGDTPTDKKKEEKPKATPPAEPDKPKKKVPKWLEEKK